MSADEQPESFEPQPFEHILDAVRRSAADLLTDAPHRPSALRVRAGDVAVEMEWETPASNGTVSNASTPNGSTSNGSAPNSAASNDSASNAQPPEPKGVVLSAPMVGVFYTAPEPGAKPFVTVGDKVGVGQQVAIIEAMKLMVPVEADRAGTVVEVLQPDAAPVEYGDPLFAIDPAA